MENCISQTKRRSANERGIVLPMAMIMLVIISFAGLIAARNAASVEQFSNNMRTSEVARQAGELALRYCEQVAIADKALTDGAEASTISLSDIAKIQTTEIASADLATAAWQTKGNWKAGGAMLISVTPSYGSSVKTDAELNNNPTCIVQKMTNSRYLVTSRGLSSDADLDTSSGELKSGSEVWLQSVLVPRKPIFPS